METQDEEPLYDSVASDDDYAYVTDQPVCFIVVFNDFVKFLLVLKALRYY